MHEKLDRPIAQHEADIIRWLLEHGDPKHLALADQIDSLRVVSKCTCGCPTVDFALNDDIPLRKGSHMIAECLATVDDQPVGVLLFECREMISMLEVYSCAGSDKPFGLPKIGDLYAWEDLSKRDGLRRR